MEITAVTLLRNQCPLGKHYSPRACSISLIPSWFLGLENVPSWLLVDGNVMQLQSGMHVGMVVDDEVLHKLVSMVEKIKLFAELMIVVVDT
ncbi:hypothetical protein Tco_1470114 [Tanacetum coccineum]